MIRFATTEDLYSLKRMWDRGFSDPLNYINFVFDRVLDPADVMVYEQDGKAVGMLTLLSVNFTYNEQRVKALYIFGSTTDKRYRMRGIMTHLLAAAEDEARRRGAAMMLLVPSAAYLFAYYKKRGYSTDFYLRSIPILAGTFGAVGAADTEISYDDVSLEDFYRLRESSLVGVPHIEWQPQQLGFVLDDSLIYGDHFARYSGEQGESYAVYNSSRRGLFVRECLGSSDMAQMVLLREIIAKHDPKSVYVIQPIHSSLLQLEGEKIPYGMAKPLYTDTYLRDLDGYMNLMLD